MRSWVALVLISTWLCMGQLAQCNLHRPLLQPGRRLSTVAASESGCASILQAAVYRVPYADGDIASYGMFAEAVCSLPADTNFQLRLPLPDATKPAFLTAGRVLVRDWQDSDVNATDLGSTPAYRVVRDYHAAVCMGLTVSGVHANVWLQGRHGALPLPLLRGCLLLHSHNPAHTSRKPVASQRSSSDHKVAKNKRP